MLHKQNGALNNYSLTELHTADNGTPLRGSSVASHHQSNHSTAAAGGGRRQQKKFLPSTSAIDLPTNSPNSQTTTKLNQSQLVFDPTSGRHYVLKEVQTSQCGSSNRGSVGIVEPEIRRSMHVAGVSASGTLQMQHDLRVSGFMTYKQRLAYARDKRNDCLKVVSPRSLLGRSTEQMYLPRNDKFEGYSQFPRPRLPSDTLNLNKKTFDSFITRRPKGEIIKGEVDKSTIPTQELLEQKALRKQKQSELVQQTQDFMDTNIGFLTGTHTGANNLIYSRVSLSQVRKDFAAPKAAPKMKKGSRTQNRTQIKPMNETMNTQDTQSNYLPSKGTLNMPSSTFTAFSKFLGPNTRQGGSGQKKKSQKNPNEIARDQAMSDMDTFIKTQLRKDPKLPELGRVDKSKVMSVMRKSDRLQRDTDTIRNLKAVLQMREQLKQNQPGKLVNGRELAKPVPINQITKRNSGSIQNAEELRSINNNSQGDQTSMDNRSQVDQSEFQSTSNAPSQSKFTTRVACSQLSLHGPRQSSKRSLFNFAATNNKSTESLRSTSHHQVNPQGGLPQQYDQMSCQMSQLSLIEKSPSQKQILRNNMSSSVFSQQQRQLQLQQGEVAVSGSGRKMTHQELVQAKKQRTQVPGYQGVKTGHRVESFLSRESKNTARNAGVSMTVNTPTKAGERSTQDNHAPAQYFQAKSGINKGSSIELDRRQKLDSRNTKTDGFATEMNKMLNDPSQSSLEKQLLIRDGSMMSIGISQDPEGVSDYSDDCISDEDNDEYQTKRKLRYDPRQTQRSPFSRVSGHHGAGLQSKKLLHQYTSNGSIGSNNNPSQSAIKGLNALRQAMFVPYKDAQPGQYDKYQAQKGKTQGRFSENTPEIAQAHRTKDMNWIQKANPGYIEQQKKQAARQEELFKKRQFNKTLKAVREEYKVGIKVSRIPPEMAAAIESMKRC